LVSSTSLRPRPFRGIGCAAATSRGALASQLPHVTHNKPELDNFSEHFFFPSIFLDALSKKTRGKKSVLAEPLAQADLGAAAAMGRVWRVPKKVHWAIGGKFGLNFG